MKSDPDPRLTPDLLSASLSVQWSLARTLPWFENFHPQGVRKGCSRSYLRQIPENLRFPWLKASGNSRVSRTTPDKSWTLLLVSLSSCVSDESKTRVKEMASPIETNTVGCRCNWRRLPKPRVGRLLQPLLKRIWVLEMTCLLFVSPNANWWPVEYRTILQASG